MNNNKLTTTEWEQFFDTLFRLVPDERALLRVCLPMWNALEAAGHGEAVMEYLSLPSKEEADHDQPG